MGICNSNNKLNKCDDTIKLFSLDKQTFNAKVVRVYDGDTCFAVFIYNSSPVKFKIRMEGYDSPEMKPLLTTINRNKEIENAIKAKEALEKLVLNKIVILECGKWDKYGRLLGKIYVKNNNNIINVNEYMVNNGFGYIYNGGTKKIIEYN